MSKITRTFTKAQIEDLDLPCPCESDRVKVISDDIVENTRWSIVHALIVQFSDDPENIAWRTYYSVGATESQDEAPWQYDKEVEFTAVRRIEKVVKVWE